MSDEDDLEKAYACGFLVRDPPPAPASWPVLEAPPLHLARRPGARIALGDLVHGGGRLPGRLGPVLQVGGRLLGFTAGHILEAVGDEVYRDDEGIGRVVALARPRSGTERLDAALLELVAEVTWTPRCAATRAWPVGRLAARGESVTLATSGPCRRGRIVALAVAANMQRGSDRYVLCDQLAIAGCGFSVDGDSGAAVVGADGEYLGLLVGADCGIAIATPMATLRRAFGLAPASWHAVPATPVAAQPPPP